MDSRMRRHRQELDKDACEAILRNATHGVLSLCGADGEPYGVPLSFVYVDGSIFFHCAFRGLKLDLLEENPKASFCVVGKDDVVPEEFTTYFKSVIAFGDARVVSDEAQRRRALIALGDKYYPGNEGESEKEVEKAGARAAVVELSIVRLTGKQARELVKHVED